MSTDQLLHNALSDMAAATDELLGGGDHIRKLADEQYAHGYIENCRVYSAVEAHELVPHPSEPDSCNSYTVRIGDEYFVCGLPRAAPVHPHVHDFKRVPGSERNDRLRFCATMFRCDECGESYTC